MNLNFFNTAEKVYKALADEQSRKIYGGMVMFNLTKDERWIAHALKDRLAWNGVDLQRIVQNHKSQPIVVFGAGNFGKQTVNMYPEIDWQCCVDNYQTGKLDTGLEIIDVQALKKKYPNAFIVVCVQKYGNDIVAQLIKEGFTKENVFAFADIYGKVMATFAERQYFDLPVLEHDSNEVFVDVGGFDGETSRYFIKWSDSHYKHIYVFEANPDLYERCCENLKKEKNCTIFGKGLWDKEAVLSFRESPHDQEFNVNLLEHNCFDKEHENLEDWKEHTISVVRMDDMIPDTRVTFIKMDIEGSEANALRGAENIIRKYRPKLAICVYHRQDDLWTIPSLILDYHPDYRLYLRTYSLGWGETVIYAI